MLVVKDKKYHNTLTQETQFIEILHTVPKWVLDNAVYKCYWIVLYIVHVTAFCLGGGAFFPDTV